MSSAAGIAIDLLMLAALGGAIWHGIRLQKQFSRLQADRKAFEQLIQALNVAAARAEAATRTLKEAALGSGEKLQEKVNAARALSDELEIIVQAGDSLAERLSALAEKSRKAATPDPEPRTRAEKELLEAVKARQQ